MSAGGGARPAGPQPALLYVVAARVPRRKAIVAGSLGSLTLERGWYAYVGSARRGRAARVARHMRAGKPLRWHADYLFSVHPASRAWLVDVAPPVADEIDGAAAAAAAGTAAWSGARAAADPGSAAAAAAFARSAECALAAALATAPSCGGRVARFGASDCGCRGHLIRFRTAADLSAAVRSAAAALNARLGRS